MSIAEDYGRAFYEPGIRIDRFCRVCYNTRSYQEPSGPEGKPTGKDVAELSDEEIFEAKRGFGHEEWLDNEKASVSNLAGFAQGFLQRTNVSKADDKLYSVALWAKFAGGKKKFSGLPGPLNPPPGSCWLVGFITHLSFVGKGALGTRTLEMPFPDDFIDPSDPARRSRLFEPNILYPKGCLKIFPREKWIMAPRAIPHRYTWLRRSNKSHADLFEWAQSVFDQNVQELADVKTARGKKPKSSAAVRKSGIRKDYSDIEPDLDEKIRQIETHCGRDPKVRQALAAMRTHQADFRQALMLQAGGRCMLSDVDRQRLLVASHIKPFSLCKAAEAYKPENGLLLARNIDVLFDAFLISFDYETGALLRAPSVDDELLAKFGISPSKTKLPMRHRTKERCKYLKWHNDELRRRSGRS